MKSLICLILTFFSIGASADVICTAMKPLTDGSGYADEYEEIEFPVNVSADEVKRNEGFEIIYDNATLRIFIGFDGSYLFTLNTYNTGSTISGTCIL